MSLQILPDLEQGSPEWHDQRRGMVTASVVGRLITTRYPGAEAYSCIECQAEPNEPCRSKVKRGGEIGVPIKGVHNSRTSYALSVRDDRALIVEPAKDDDSRALTTLLAAERIAGFTEDNYISNDMWRGIEDEPVARDLYSQHYASATEVGFMVRDDWGFRIGFSPDGVVGDTGLIEIKSRRAKRHVVTILSNKVPAENMAQLQCGLLVSGREWIDYISYCGGLALWVKRVYPDPKWFKAIVSAVETFESAAEGIVYAYTEATKDLTLPVTERRVELEMV